MKCVLVVAAFAIGLPMMAASFLALGLGAAWVGDHVGQMLGWSLLARMGLAFAFLSVPLSALLGLLVCRGSA